MYLGATWEADGGGGAGGHGVLWWGWVTFTMTGTTNSMTVAGRARCVSRASLGFVQHVLLAVQLLRLDDYT